MITMPFRFLQKSGSKSIAAATLVSGPIGHKMISPLCSLAMRTKNSGAGSTSGMPLGSINLRRPNPSSPCTLELVGKGGNIRG